MSLVGAACCGEYVDCSQEDYEAAVELFVDNLLNTVARVVDQDEYDDDMCGIDFPERAPYAFCSDEEDEEEDEGDLPRALCNFFQAEGSVRSGTVPSHRGHSKSETTIQAARGSGGSGGARSVSSIPTIVVTKHFDDDEDEERADAYGEGPATRPSLRRHVSWLEDQSGDSASVGRQRAVLMPEQARDLLQTLKKRVNELEGSADDRIEAAFQSGLRVVGARLQNADRMIGLLQERLASLMSEREHMMNYINEEERQFVAVKSRLNEEIVAQRRLVTQALSDKLITSKKLGRNLKCSLLNAKKSADNMIESLMEKDRKIREMGLVIRRQHAYHMILEGELAHLQAEINSQARDLVDKPVFPCRADGEQHVYSRMPDVLHTANGDYQRGNDHDPDVATANFFSFDGGAEYEAAVAGRQGEVFDSAKLAYYRGMSEAAKMIEQIELLEADTFCDTEQRARAMLATKHLDWAAINTGCHTHTTADTATAAAPKLMA